MATMANLSLTVSGVAQTFVVAAKQNGTIPSTWERGHASGTLLFADVISHNVSAGAQNRNVSLRLLQRRIGPDAAGADSVLATVGTDIKMSFPKSSTSAERTAHLDLIIAFLTAQKTAIASTEVYI